MASNGLSAKISRRGLLQRSVVVAGASVLAANVVIGCSQIPIFGSKPKLAVWANPTFAPSSDDYQTKVIQDWAKQNGVDVEVTRDNNNDTKIQAAVESKQFPDVAEIDPIKYWQSGAQADVSDLYREVGAPWGGFYPPAEKTVTHNGKQWSLPYSIDSNLILYWKTILDAGNVKDVPKTWDTWLEVGKRLQKPPDLYGIGIGYVKVGDSDATFWMMALSYGANLVTPDSQKTTIKTAEMKDFLGEAKKIWDAGVVPPGATGWDNASNNTALQDGKAIMIHNPASPLVWFRANKPDDLPKIGVTSTPGGPKGQFNQSYVRDNFGLMQTGDDKKMGLSRDLMRMLFSNDIYRKWIGLAFPAPAVKGMEDHPVWQNPQRAGFLAAAKTGVLDGYPGEPTKAWNELSAAEPLTTMVTRLIIDKWTIDQAIDEVDKIAKAIYAKYYK